MAAQNKFSTTQCNIDAEMAKAVCAAAAEIPDDDLAEGGRTAEPHITLKYGLHTNDATEVQKVLQDEPPIKARLGKTSIFAEAGMPHEVVKVDVESDDLKRLNAKVAEALEHTDTHPDYKPHVTLAYVKIGRGEKHAGKDILAGKEVQFGSVSFRACDGTMTDIPLKPIEAKIDEEEECDEDDDECREEIDAGCKVTAEQAAVAMQSVILAENPYHDRLGRFTTKDGAELGDDEANAVRDLASATGRAANKGVVSHKVAAETYERAAKEAERVAKRSAEEFEKATKRGDKLGQAAHMTEANRAAQNVMTFRKMASEHSGTPDSGTVRTFGGTTASAISQLARSEVGKEVAKFAWEKATGTPAGSTRENLATGLKLFQQWKASGGKAGPGMAKAGVDPSLASFSSSFGSATEALSSFTVGGKAPSERTFRRAAAARRDVTSSDIVTAAILASAGAGDILAYNPNHDEMGRFTSAADSASAEAEKTGTRTAHWSAMDRHAEAFDYASQAARKMKDAAGKEEYTKIATKHLERIGYHDAAIKTLSSQPSKLKTFATRAANTAAAMAMTGLVGALAMKALKSNLATPRQVKDYDRETSRQPSAYRPPSMSASEIVEHTILATQTTEHPPIEASPAPSFPDIVGTQGSADIQAAFTAGEVTPRFTVAPAYNGGPLKVGGYDMAIIVDLAGMTVNQQSVQAVLFHDGERLVGHVDSVRNNGKTLELSGPMSGLSTVVSEFLGSVRAKFPWKASIEARPLAKPEFIREGQKVSVNGRTFDGPVLVARKTELYGISFVPRGADDKTVVSIAAQAAKNRNHHYKENPKMEPSLTFEQWLDAVYPKPIQAKMDDADKASAKELYDNAMKALTEAGAGGGDGGTITAQDTFDLDDIRAGFDDAVEDSQIIFAKYEDCETLARKDLRQIQGETKKELRDLKAKAIEGRWDKPLFESKCATIHAAAELKLLRASRPTGPTIISTPARPEVTSDVIEAAMCQAMKWEMKTPVLNEKTGQQENTIIAKLEDKFTPETLDKAHKLYRGRIGLQQMLLHAAQANGFAGHEFPKGHYKEVLAFAFNTNPYGNPIHAEGESALSLDGILSNYMNKFLLQGFYMVEQVWRKICTVKPVNDFKTSYSYRMSADSEFQKLGPTGEIKIGTLSDETFTNQAATYARGFNLDRRVIINDDLGAMTQLPIQIGRGSGVALNKMFWTAFMDNSTFFQTSGNAITSVSGADSALSIDGLTAAEKAFVAMKDVNGNPIGHYPSIVLVPPDLSALASQLYTSTQLQQVATALTSTSAASKSVSGYPINNPHANKFVPVMSRYLNNQNFTGYSTTAWYLMGDPQMSGISTIEVVFLYGQEAPTIENTQADFDTLGIKFRGFHDAGCTKQDHRGAVKMAGA